MALEDYSSLKTMVYLYSYLSQIGIDSSQSTYVRKCLMLNIDMIFGM